MGPGASSSTSGTYNLQARHTVLDDYRPLLELGRGGMARVYLAEKNTRGLRRLVVLKVLDPALAENQEMRVLFRREAEVCARLHHPNIVQVFEVIEETTCPLMVMEYLEGVSLSQVLARSEQHLPVRLHVHVLIQVLSGLHYFHELKNEAGALLSAVHRDVSPQNVIVLHEGAVKVLDFGIAKLRDQVQAEVTHAGVIKGKLNYMPPEQLAGDATIDRRADVFAVGVMLWEAFARRRLWQGRTQQQIVEALINDEVPKIKDACPSISEEWAQVIMKALAVRRDERFASALELQMAVEACLPELGGAVQPRELASFMAQEFGEARRERQRLVDVESKKAPVPLASLLGESISGMSELQRVHETPVGESQSFTALQPRRSLTPVVLAVLAVAGGAGAYLLSTHAQEKQSPSAPPAPVKRKVTLEVRAEPASAELVLDGEVLPSNPYRSEIEASERRAHLVVRAVGYQAIERDIELNADALLNVELKPASPPVATEAPSAAPPESSGKHRASRQRTIVRPPVPAPVPSRQPSAPPSNCTPPYVLSSDGVKTYKPECL